MTDERHPVERLVDERLDALVDRDWERYRALGQELLTLTQERDRISPPTEKRKHE